MLARIKNCFSGPEKRIVSADGDLLQQTEIRAGQDPRRAPGDVRQRRYSLVDAAGKEIAQAQPDYAAGDEPETVGWPVCRTPRVDHAQVRMEGDYELVMQNSQNYQLQQSSGETLVQIIGQGWGTFTTFDTLAVQYQKQGDLEQAQKTADQTDYYHREYPDTKRRQISIPDVGGKTTDLVNKICRDSLRLETKQIIQLRRKNNYRYPGSKTGRYRKRNELD